MQDYVIGHVYMFASDPPNVQNILVKIGFKNFKYALHIHIMKKADRDHKCFDIFIITALSPCCIFIYLH